MRHPASSVLRAAAWLAVAAAAVGARAAPDSGALIAALARDPPAHIAFAEVRFSSLLVEPLVVGGTLEYADTVTLNRRVETPYRENTTIGPESVRVERANESPRTFALRRAPELRGLSAAMLGLLRGDAALLEQHFRLSATGDDAGWRLDLTPVDERLSGRIEQISVLGTGAEPRCYVSRDREGGGSVMLLGPAAARPLPEPLALPALVAHCAME